MDESDDEVEMSNRTTLNKLPVRPSSGLKKVTAGTMAPPVQKLADVPGKAMFPAGYTNAVPNDARNLYKSTVKNQHNMQNTGATPLDMANVSKAPIPFAPNPNPAGPSYNKTPVHHSAVKNVKSVTQSGAKAATRSSPRFQNGDSIELPDINTDDEDEYSDEERQGMFPNWTDSPALRRALMEQETVDPLQVFGVPGELNLEEVFSKSKERFHKFRARTSSANWSGADRLTEDDIRKDLAAREKLRREGAWTYEMGRDL
jgi:hypothetical protein